MLGPELIQCTGSQPTSEVSIYLLVVSSHYFLQGLRSPSQLKNVTVLWLVPSYTAWWQRHISLNSLLQGCYAALYWWELNLRPIDRKFNTLPLRHCATFSTGGVRKTSNVWSASLDIHCNEVKSRIIAMLYILSALLLLYRYDPNTDMPADIDTPQDRVIFIKSVASFMVSFHWFLSAKQHAVLCACGIGWNCGRYAIELVIFTATWAGDMVAQW